METKIVEATNGPYNWGKFLVARYDVEWGRRSVVCDSGGPLLNAIGASHDLVWVLDLQTREGAAFKPGGYAKADLDKHKIWVCPLFEAFLTWLYTQDLTGGLDQLPDQVEVDAPFEFRGYRREGPKDDRENNIIVAGGVFAALTRSERDPQIELDPRIVTVDDQATNAITIKPHFMKSRYRLTVEHVPDEDGDSASQTVT